MARVNSLPSHGATNFCNTASQNEADLPLLLIFNMDGELRILAEASGLCTLIMWEI